MHHSKTMCDLKLELQSGNAQFWVKIRDFCSCDLEIWWMTLKKIGHLLHTTFSFVFHFTAIGEFKLELQSGNAQFGSKSVIFCPCDLEIWLMTMKSNSTPLLYHIKLYALYQSHWWIQTWVTVRKRSIWVKIGDFVSHVTFKIDRWPWKIIGDLFYVGPSFVHHLIANTEFKPELQSAKAQFGSKSMIFVAVWPWNLTDDLEKQ